MNHGCLVYIYFFLSFPLTIFIIHFFIFFLSFILRLFIIITIFLVGTMTLFNVVLMIFMNEFSCKKYMQCKLWLGDTRTEAEVFTFLFFFFFCRKRGKIGDCSGFSFIYFCLLLFYHFILFPFIYPLRKKIAHKHLNFQTILSKRTRITKQRVEAITQNNQKKKLSAR